MSTNDALIKKVGSNIQEKAALIWNVTKRKENSAFRSYQKDKRRIRHKVYTAG